MRLIIVEMTNESLKAMRRELRKIGINRRTSGHIVMSCVYTIARRIPGESAKRVAWLPISEYTDIEWRRQRIRFKFI